MRPIEPSDMESLREGFERLSPESRFRRFHSPTDELTAAQLRYLAEVDHHDHEALIALEPGNGQALGVARFVREADHPNRADAAVAVADDWQGAGLGTLLLEQLADRAREEGIERFTLLIQADNQKALGLFDRLGARRTGRGSGEVELELEVPQKGIGTQLAAALRAAAEQALAWRSLANRVLERAAESIRF